MGIRMTASDYLQAITAKRLEGLLAGTIEPGWPGEYWYRLGEVWGAGGCQ